MPRLSSGTSPAKRESPGANLSAKHSMVSALMDNLTTKNAPKKGEDRCFTDVSWSFGRSKMVERDNRQGSLRMLQGLKMEGQTRKMVILLVILYQA